MGTVPSGTVTFLFTDIESSARHWETTPDAMTHSLSRHDEVLRGAIERHRGYVFATGGDGFAAAFTRADDAVAAARAVQRGLGSEGGVGGLELRVRIGMHTGVTEERDENYFGAAVNRAARVMAAAHGGQTLASLATVSTLSDRTGVTDLGRHRLRDLLGPEQLFLIDGHPSDHPPLRTMEAHDHNLPVLRLSVFGLDDLISDVVAGLNAHGMVTLTGMGGVGKTRLALEVAARLMPEHELTRFVDLSPISDESDVVRVLAESVGVNAPDLEAVISYLGVRDSLLIIDNCEHVVDAARDVVEVLRRRCVNCAVLATSREPLGVEGEHVRPVRTLPLDRAMELFVDRAASVRPELALDDNGSRVHVEEICTRLDGIPLALELAAARVAHMSPADIAARLDDRFLLLSGGRRRSRQRHQTLQATMDWSYELLDADEQSLLRAVAVFAGGFDAEAAAAVWGRSSIETLDVLGALIDWSLLSVSATGDPSRYGMLETVRVYALGRLVAKGEAEQRRVAHADHYFGALRSLDTDELVAYTLAHGLYWPTGRPDLDNHLAALEWFDQGGRRDRVAAMAGRLILAHGSGRWADDEDRYLGRQDLIDGAQADRALYLAASALNSNVFARWHDELRFARLGLETADGMVRILLLMMAEIATWAVEADQTRRFIDEALDLAPDDHVRRVLEALGAARLIALGDIDQAHDTFRRLEAESRRAGAADQWESAIDDLTFLEVILGHDDHLSAESAERPATWSRGRVDFAHAVIAARAGDRSVSAARLLRGAAQLDVGIRLLEHDFTIAAALCAVHLGSPHHACRLLAVVPGTVRSPGSLQLLLHARSLVREQLDRDTVAAIRTEMANADPVAVLRDEIDRLRATTRVDSSQGEPNATTR